MPLAISENLDALIVRLTHPAKIVIVPHQGPDGDAMGSCLGLLHYLNDLGHRPVLISPTAYPAYFDWMPQVAQTLVYPEDTPRANELIDKADIIFCLDFGELHRAADAGKRIAQSYAVKVNIDHHILPPGYSFADYVFRDEQASSTCELVYDFIMQHNPQAELSKDLATCLYTGLVTDTGGFRYSMNPRVHEVAAALLRAGVDSNEVNFHLFSNFSENRTRFMGFALHQCLHVLPAHHTAYISLPFDQQQSFQLEDGDTEGLVNYALSIRGVNFAVLFSEKPDMIRINFRSIGKFACNEFAANFNGGGHHNASGGRSLVSLEETIEKFLSLLPNYQSQLDYEF